MFGKYVLTIFGNPVNHKKHNMSSSSDEDVAISASKSKTLQKYRKKGHFQPRNHNTLYAKVIHSNATELIELANNWTNEYEDNYKNALIMLHQFIIDVCGFEEFSVHNNCEKNDLVDTDNFLKLLIKLERDIHNKYQSMKIKYLLDSNNKGYKRIITNLFEFWGNILKLAHRTEILYNGIMLSSLMNFMEIFITSNIYGIYHTSAIFLIKTITSLNDIRIDLKYSKEVHRRISLEHTNSLLSNAKVIGAQENCLQMIYQNCVLKDKMIVEYPLEITNWIKKLPEYFFNSKCFDHLIQLVEHKVDKLSEAAITTCQLFVKTNKFEKYLNEYLNKLMLIIGNRIGDKSTNVAIAAITFYQYSASTYVDYIPHKYRDFICALIYSKSSALAAAAGKFLLEYCHDSNPQKVIDSIIRLSFCEKISIPDLVESFISSTPLLQNWNFMIDLLLGDQLPLNNQIALISIVSESVYQTIKGTPSVKRRDSRTEHVNPHVVHNITEIFLVKMPDLLEKYYTNLDAFEPLANILLYLDYDETANDEQLKKIVMLLHECLIQGDDYSKFLNQILKAFIDGPSKNKINDYLTLFQSTIVSNYVFAIKQFQECNEFHGELQLLKLSSVYPYYNLNKLAIEDWGWNLLQVYETHFSQEVLPNSIMCCYWFIIWEMRTIIEDCLIDDNDLQYRIDLLKTRCETFTYACFKKLNESDNFQVKKTACECIIDMYLTFTHELKDAVKSNELLKQLYVPIPEEHICNKLLDFGEEVIFSSSVANEKFKCLLLKKMLACGAQYYKRLLRYYVADYDEYAEVFTKYLKSVQDSKIEYGVALVIFDTLADYFEYTQINVEGDEETYRKHVNNLKELTLQFRDYIHDSNEATVFLVLGINYATKDFKFFAILKYFINSLNFNDKNEILNYVQEKISEDDINNDNYVKMFIDELNK